MNAARRYITGTNYCGPGGTGRVIGALDEACRIHDSDYKAPYYMDYFRSQKADKVFLRRLAGSNPRGFKQRLTRDFARGYFTYKTALWDSFDKMRGRVQAGDGYVVNPQEAQGRIGFQRKKRRSHSQSPRENDRIKTRLVLPPPPGYRGYGGGLRYFRRVPYMGTLYRSKRIYLKRKRIFSRFRRRYRS